MSTKDVFKFSNMNDVDFTSKDGILVAKFNKQFEERKIIEELNNAPIDKQSFKNTKNEEEKYVIAIVPLHVDEDTIYKGLTFLSPCSSTEVIHPTGEEREICETVFNTKNLFFKVKEEKKAEI